MNKMGKLQEEEDTQARFSKLNPAAHIGAQSSVARRALARRMTRHRKLRATLKERKKLQKIEVEEAKIAAAIDALTEIIEIVPTGRQPSAQERKLIVSRLVQLKVMARTALPVVRTFYTSLHQLRKDYERLVSEVHALAEIDMKEAGVLAMNIAPFPYGAAFNPLVRPMATEARAYQKRKVAERN